LNTAIKPSILVALEVLGFRDCPAWECPGAERVLSASPLRLRWIAGAILVHRIPNSQAAPDCDRLKYRTMVLGNLASSVRVQKIRAEMFRQNLPVRPACAHRPRRSLRFATYALSRQSDNRSRWGWHKITSNRLPTCDNAAPVSPSVIPLFHRGSFEAPQLRSKT
jgi:hypothetical protein